MWKDEVGIDTLSYYYGLTPRQKRIIVSKLTLLPDFFTEGDYWEETHIYRSNCFQDQGVKLTISRIKGSRWGLLVVLHPALILGETDRSKIYQLRKKREYQHIVEQADQLLERIGITCSVDDMKLYRCDLTKNRMFDEEKIVSEYIRILKKSCLLPHYSWDKFREDEHKARNCKVANRHSCKQVCKSAAFFVYDKTAQLEMIEAFPAALIGNRILRLEAQLRRKAMKKWVGKKRMGKGNWAIIKVLGKNAENILQWYLHRVHPVRGRHLHYRDTVEIVSHVKGKKIKERMLYLLRKTSDSDNLTLAQKKMKEKFRLSESQCRTVLKKLQKLNISPITLVNSSGFMQLPGINSL